MNSHLKDWENTNLGSLLKNKKEIGHNEEELLSVTGEKGIVRRNSLERRDTSNNDKSKYLLVEKGDIAYNTMRMWQGVSGVSSYRGIVSPAYTVCSPTKKIDSIFAGYLLKDPVMISLFKRRSQGLVSDTWNLKYEKFAEISCNIPPLCEQKKIAQILTEIDKSIEGFIFKKLHIEKTRRSFIQQFTRGYYIDGPRKNSGTEFGMIPSHWSCEPLPKCCKLENNKRKPIKADDRKKMRGKYPYHGATKIQDYISEYSFEGEYTLIGEDGDHFSKYNSWEMAQYAFGRFNVSNHAHVIGSTSKCSSKWFYYSMLHRDLTLYLTRQGATRFKLSKASLEEVPVLLPPINEQLKMIKILDTFSNLINALEKKIIKLSILKQGISSELLSGRKRVKI